LSICAPSIPPGRSPVHPLALGLWSAEYRPVDGRSFHYVVAHTGEEVAGGLAVADQKIGS
jgi:hypothetical protein